jgi:hypothetical protein
MLTMLTVCSTLSGGVVEHRVLINVASVFLFMEKEEGRQQQKA